MLGSCCRLALLSFSITVWDSDILGFAAVEELVASVPHCSSF